MDYLSSFNKVFNKKHRGYFMKREYRTPGPLPALKILTVELWFIGSRNKKKDLIKILGKGELSCQLTVTAHAFSATAKEAIEKNGGSVNIIGAPADQQ